MEPSWAQRSWLKPHARPAIKPDLNESPTPVGSIFAFSCGTPTWTNSPFFDSTFAPFEPSVTTRYSTRLRISASVQPVFCIASANSYSFKNRYLAPVINWRISSPLMRAICWEGSAAKAIPSWRQTSEWRNIASGSSGEITTISKRPVLPMIGASSMFRASDIAPGKKDAIWFNSVSVVTIKCAVNWVVEIKTCEVSTPCRLNQAS